MYYILSSVLAPVMVWDKADTLLFPVEERPLSERVLRLKIPASLNPMPWLAGFTPPPSLALLSMPVRPAGCRQRFFRLSVGWQRRK